MNTKKYSRELIAGCFVLLGLVCIAYMAVKLGKMELFSQKGYFVTAEFSTASGLRVGADVEIAGVNIGRVTEIGLDQQASVARVTMNVRDDIVMGVNTIASIRTSGIIGDKFIDITPGDISRPLPAGGVITATMGAANLDGLVNIFSMTSAYSAEAYTVNAVFSSVAGLSVGAAVQISGVSVGQIAGIELDHVMGTATVAMRIDKDVELPDDIMASVKTNGLIGGKYISLSLGASETLLADGDTIYNTESSMDIESLISKYAFSGD